MWRLGFFEITVLVTPFLIWFCEDDEKCKEWCDFVTNDVKVNDEMVFCVPDVWKYFI